MQNNVETSEIEVKDVPYIVHEGVLARMERQIKRLWVLCIIIFAALIITNAAWIYYENQWIDEEITVTQENTDGINNYGNGDIYNGTADSNQKDTD